MAIIKEKKHIWLGISLFVITIATGVIQYSDSKVDEWENNISRLQNFQNNIYGLVTNKQELMHYYTLLDIFKVNIISLAPGEAEFIASGQFYEELKELVQKFERKEITSQEYIRGRKNTHSKEYHNFLAMYNDQVNSTDRLYIEGPKSEIWKWTVRWDNLKRIFIWILIVTIIASATIYLWLYLSIGKRYYTSVENKNKALIEENIKLKEELSKLKKE